VATVAVYGVGHLRNDKSGDRANSARLDKPSTVADESLQLNAEPFSGSPAIGALFTKSASGSLQSHFCTASVVDSPKGDLVVTAAHCTNGRTAGQLVFVPDYMNGQEPFGVWSVKSIVVDQDWVSDSNPDHDFAFLVISPDSAGSAIQQVTGGETVTVNQGSKQNVRVSGYPDGLNAPITCSNPVSMFSATQLQFDCGGYTDGTSGSPLLTSIDPATGLGDVIGVIGGYEQGGDTPSVSYAATFTGDLSNLFQKAIASS
jgi:V8-like Glu-specific endopeptidase